MKFNTILGIIVALVPVSGALAEQSRAKAVISTDFGDSWPLTVYSGMVNCVRNGQAILISDGGVYAMNGVAKSFADQYGYRDIREISKPHPKFPDVEADISPLLKVALDMC